jgi:hypothetical protein
MVPLTPSPSILYSMQMTDPSQNAEALEAEGDALAAAKDLPKALAKYQEAEAVEKERPELYGKMISIHAEITEEWSRDDFALSLSWEMQKQALEHPEVRAAHERLSPEWQAVTERLHRLLIADTPEDMNQLAEEVAEYRENAVRPLLDFILLLKQNASKDDTA